jgi:plasmid stability protein
MAVNLSIKNAPDDVVQRLRERAARNHRSLQGELMAIIEEAVKEPKPARRFNIDEVRARIRALGLNSPDESTAIIRADRDAGHRDH